MSMNAFNVAVGMGRSSGMSVVSKFGVNNDVGTGAYEDIWVAGGTYNWLTAAAPVRVRAGGNVNDTSAGTGARTITVVGLNGSFEQMEEVITLAGASASAATSASFFRVFRAYVTDAGTYTGNNAGDILIETTGGTLVAQIGALLGQTQLGLYTIPAGKRGFMTRLRIQVSQQANKTADVRVWQRPRATTVAAPFGGKRLVREFSGAAGAINVITDVPIEFAPMTDVWMSAIGASNATTVDVAFDILLVDQ